MGFGGFLRKENAMNGAGCTTIEKRVTILVGRGVWFACAFVFVQSAYGQADPAGCSGSKAAVTLSVVPTIVASGQSATFTVKFVNDLQPGCSVQDVVISNFCPDATGQPTIPATPSCFNKDGSGGCVA